jgi:ribosomal protein S18 acetylase RimI-like enzyme
MSVAIRPMMLDDYDGVMALWQSVDGVGLSQADTREAIGRYLDRNQGLSQCIVVNETGEIVGAVLCGHDGRRGFLHHLAVNPKYRHQGLGQLLAKQCLKGLHQQGIDKCHLFVFNKNQVGRNFWKKAGWYERSELVLISIDC